MIEKYCTVKTINESHKIYLVKSLQDNSLYVKKELDIFDIHVYEWLEKHYVDGVPKVMEIEETDGKLCVIEEYIKGETLENLLNEKGKMNEKDVRCIAISICKILKKINDLIPLVHRDIKPTNILIDEKGKLYLIDFNIAKIFDESKNKDTILLGTEGYAAPEQYGFSSSNIQTDIFAIGVLMKELLTTSIDLNENYNSNLKPIIQKCTMLDPSKRYSNYETLIGHLEKKHFFANEYLPVGFRSGNIFNMMLASVCYMFIIFLASGLVVENTSDTALLITKIGFVITFIIIIFFSGNYLNCQDKLKIFKIKNKIPKILIIIIIDLFIFASVMTVTLLLANLFNTLL